MAGLIDVGILKPELADYGRMEQQRNLLVQQKQQAELSQLKLDQLKQDQAMLNDLQTKLRANGRSDDPKQFFQALIQTGNPDYVAKGYEGLQRYTELQRANELLRKEAPELFGPAPGAATPTAVPSAPSAPSIMRMQPPAAAAAPVNALGSGTFDPNAAPVNALAPAAAPAATAPAAAPSDRARDLRNKILLYSSSGDPRLKAMADVYKEELKELTKPQTLSPGQQLYSGGKVLYTAPEKDSEFERLLKTSNLSDAEKTRLRVLRAQKEATHAPGVSVSMTQEKAESADYGKFLVDQFKNVSKASDLAQKSMPAIESNLNILDKGFDTGFGTETVAAGAKVLGALGVKDAEKFATNSQTFLANANAAVLQKQLEQKGPQTEADAQRISATGAQLGNTKDANKFVLNVAKAQLQRDIDQRNFYADWRKARKTLDGAEDAWNAGPGSKSLFENPALKKYTAPTNANATPTAPRLSLDAIFTPK